MALHYRFSGNTKRNGRSCLRTNFAFDTEGNDWIQATREDHGYIGGTASVTKTVRWFPMAKNFGETETYMTRAEVAKRLGWRKDLVRSVEAIALAKMRIALGVGTRADRMLTRRRQKRCKKCGYLGHEKGSCL